MRVEKTEKIVFLSVLAWVLCFGGFLLPKNVSADNINFSQSILPVRFVYLNKSGSIEKIWSNISGKDSLYVVKCIDSKSQNEISMNENVLVSYQDMVKRSGAVSGTIFPNMAENYFSQKNEYSIAIDFIKSNNYIEEVHTYS
jgi:hypothetical protein